MGRIHPWSAGVARAALFDRSRIDTAAAFILEPAYELAADDARGTADSVCSCRLISLKEKQDASYTTTCRSSGDPRSHGLSPGNVQAAQRAGGGAAARPEHAHARGAGADCDLCLCPERLLLLSNRSRGHCCCAAQRQ